MHDIEMSGIIIKYYFILSLKGIGTSAITSYLHGFATLLEVLLISLNIVLDKAQASI